jgi:hypothetical protein
VSKWATQSRTFRKSLLVRPKGSRDMRDCRARISCGLSTSVRKLLKLLAWTLSARLSASLAEPLAGR